MDVQPRVKRRKEAAQDNWSNIPPSVFIEPHSILFKVRVQVAAALSHPLDGDGREAEVDAATVTFHQSAFQTRRILAQSEDVQTCSVVITCLVVSASASPQRTTTEAACSECENNKMFLERIWKTLNSVVAKDGSGCFLSSSDKKVRPFILTFSFPHKPASASCPQSTGTCLWVGDRWAGAGGVAEPSRADLSHSDRSHQSMGEHLRRPR